MTCSLKCFLLTTAICFFNCLSFGQQNVIDSLCKLLKTDKADTNELIHLNKVSREYFNIGSYDSSLRYANSALKVINGILSTAQDPAILQTSKKGEARAYNNIGNAYYIKGEYQEAIKNYSTSLKISESIHDKKGIANSLQGIGLVYVDQGNYPEALKKYLASLKLREEIGDQLGISTSYNNIGTIYAAQATFPSASKTERDEAFALALQNYKASLKIREALNDKPDMSYSYNNIGACYGDLGNYDEALKNYFASLKIREEIGDKEGIATSYYNIGITYAEQGKYADALEKQFASLKIREEVGDKAAIVQSYMNIGLVFRKQKKYKEAESYLIKAIAQAKELRYKEFLRNTYAELMMLDSATGNFKGAYDDHKLFIRYRDSLDNEDTRRKTIQTQMNFDFEKKEAVATAEHKKELENQQALSEEKSRKQNIVTLFIAIGLLLVIVFAGFIFRSLRTTRMQKLVIEEKQKEILDSIKYAKRIQLSLLPTEKYIERKMKELNRK